MSTVLVSIVAMLLALVPIWKSYDVIWSVFPVMFAVTFMLSSVVRVTLAVTPAACSSLPLDVVTFVSSPVFTCSE